LDVDERRLAGVAVGRLGGEIEAVDLVVAGQGAPDEPLHSLVPYPLVDAETLQDLQRALGIADAARGRTAHADRIVVVQHDCRNATRGAIARGRQPGQAAADYDDRIATILAGDDAGTGLATELRRPAKRVARKLV